MITKVTVSCEGGSLPELSRLVAARAKVLRGETTENAVKATSINVLKSLRADTMVVGKNPYIIDNRWRIDIECTAYKSGWAYPPIRGRKSGRRVIRAAGGGAIDRDENDKKIINLAGDYQGPLYESTLRVYRLKVYELPSVKPFYERMFIAQTKDEIFKWARTRIIRRIGQYRGISKRMLGIMMHKVSTSQGLSPTGELGRLADKMADVRAYGSGFSSGSFTVKAVDGLPYSAEALKSGPGGVMRAMKKAANSTAALLTRKTSQTTFGQKFDTPFPEVRGKGK